MEQKRRRDLSAVIPARLMALFCPAPILCSPDLSQLPAPVGYILFCSTTPPRQIFLSRHFNTFFILTAESNLGLIDDVFRFLSNSIIWDNICAKRISLKVQSPTKYTRKKQPNRTAKMQMQKISLKTKTNS